MDHPCSDNHTPTKIHTLNKWKLQQSHIFMVCLCLSEQPLRGLLSLIQLFLIPQDCLRQVGNKEGHQNDGVLEQDDLSLNLSLVKY